MIHVQGLQVTKNGNAICRVSELSIERGERVAVIGPNGSGKTTLLRVLAELERDFTGECRIDAGRLDRVFVHQSPILFRGSVIKNVRYGLAAHGVKRKDRQELATSWLDSFGIAGKASTHVDKLSGGEARRTALARALILRPRLVLLDEPLADLDDIGVELLRKAIDDLPESTFVVTSPIELPTEMLQRTVRLPDQR